jgi:hypothetical protein
MDGFLLSSNSNFQRMSAPGATSPSASPGEIWMSEMCRVPFHRHANDSITQKSNARWEAEAGMMQSIFSRSLLQVHLTSRCKPQTQMPRLHHPPSKNQQQKKDISDHLFVQVHPPSLPSIQPSPRLVHHHAKCKFTLDSNLETICSTRISREHAGPTMLAPPLFPPPMIMNHHLTHSTCKEKSRQ